MKIAFITLAASLQLVLITAKPVERRDYWPVCGWIGWDIKESFWSSTDGSYVGCSTACFSQPNCKSFSFNNKENGGDCNLYDVNVVPNINWDISSPYVFWDRDCESKFQSCNVKAYQANTGPYYWTDKWTASQCADACAADLKCKSFATAPNECYLYGVPTKSNMDGPGDYLFSDVGCVRPPGNTTSATTTTAPTAQVPTTTTTSKLVTTTTTSKKTTTTTTTTSKKTTTTTTTKKTITTTKTTTKSTTTTTKSAATTNPVTTTTRNAYRE